MTPDDVHNAVAELVDAQKGRNASAWMNASNYLAWRAYLKALAEEHGLSADMGTNSDLNFSSTRAAEALCRAGVPGEQIIGQFKLLFPEPT